jgi:uncharacterized protein YyaL (SSP411 family)
LPNRLSRETSPYLLQHADNPVDWYPWGEEALTRARETDRPVLLSIGYAACHWCHVMEHESFENAEIAALMNREFVCVKVDREERPDLDAIYMQAVQAMTGHGGWPMTVFLTPDGVPFYGGTYYPPADRQGMPGFPRVLRAVAEAYRTRRDEVVRSGAGLVEQLRSGGQLGSDTATADASLLDQAFTALASQSDPAHGGFGGAPKFPQPMVLDFLLRYWQRSGDARARSIVETTLGQMAAGGIYDQLGGGFHRYSTDAFWQIPHFEKMLYDNAQLSRVYLAAYQATGERFYRRIAEETIDYVLREMTDPEGGFYSTQDADSEGEEGKFFAWSRNEILEALGEPEGTLFAARYGVQDSGNFEGKNVLHVARSVADAAAEAAVDPQQAETLLERARRTLYRQREQRVHPARDDKVITAWNGLMLRALAEAARALDRDDYRAAAEANAEFLWRAMWDGSRLRRTWRRGEAKGAGYLEDYACLLNGLLSLYEATFDVRWFAWAQALAEVVRGQFADAGEAGFFDTPADHESLVLRPKEFFDNAMPSGNSALCEGLLRLAAFTGAAADEQPARTLLDRLLPAAARYPTAFGHLLCAASFAFAAPVQIAVVGAAESELTQSLIRAVFTPYLPNKVVAGAAPGDERPAQLIPLLAGRTGAAAGPLAYVCEHFACRLPASDPDALADQLRAARA